ncbi:MAG: VOC family protein [Propionicimonas sp.]|uniref:VOC family protein n=1 Tax=Propionicimonas sp. TaxID=1955623 RepID=UPI003D0CEB7D
MTAAPVLRLTSLTVSCPAPAELAAFYARLLGAEVVATEPAAPGEPEGAGWAQLDAGGFRVNFEHERHWTPPTWPAVDGHQTATQHLDIQVDDLDAARRWALECGATLASVQPQTDVWVMVDPAGHPFCLFT